MTDPADEGPDPNDVRRHVKRRANMLKILCQDMTESEMERMLKIWRFKGDQDD